MEDTQYNLKEIINDNEFPPLQMISEDFIHGPFDEQCILEEHKNINNILQIKSKKIKNIGNKCSKSRKEKKVVEENVNLKKGHWTPQENKRYHWFLQIYNEHFVKKHLRRMDKIFKTMAIFIGTREAEQCRSHHQKMQKKYHTFYKIITSLRYHFFDTLSPDPLITELKDKEIKIINKIMEVDEINSQENLNQNIKTQHIRQDCPEFMDSHSEDLFGNKYQLNLPFNFQ